MFGLELLFIAWCIRTATKDPPSETEQREENSDSFTKYTSGYDYSRGIFWDLKQTYKIEH